MSYCPRYEVRGRGSSSKQRGRGGSLLMARTSHLVFKAQARMKMGSKHSVY